VGVGVGVGFRLVAEIEKVEDNSIGGLFFSKSWLRWASMEEKGMGRRDVAEGPGVEEEEDKNKKKNIKKEYEKNI
jgi:hypothetical protein